MPWGPCDLGEQVRRNGNLVLSHSACLFLKLEMSLGPRQVEQAVRGVTQGVQEGRKAWAGEMEVKT